MAKVHSGEKILPKASTHRVGCTNVKDKIGHDVAKLL